LGNGNTVGMDVHHDDHHDTLKNTFFDVLHQFCLFVILFIEAVLKVFNRFVFYYRLYQNQHPYRVKNLLLFFDEEKFVEGAEIGPISQLMKNRAFEFLLYCGKEQ
jgi:hypothetical protein